MFNCNGLKYLYLFQWSKVNKWKRSKERIIFIYLISKIKTVQQNIIIHSQIKSISVAARSKAWVWGRSLAGIAVSNPAGVWMSVCCDCCMLSSSCKTLERLATDWMIRGSNPVGGKGFSLFLVRSYRPRDMTLCSSGTRALSRGKSHGA